MSGDLISPQQLYDEPGYFMTIPEELQPAIHKLMDKMFEDWTTKVTEYLKAKQIEVEMLSGLPDDILRHLLKSTEPKETIDRIQTDIERVLKLLSK